MAASKPLLAVLLVVATACDITELVEATPLVRSVDGVTTDVAAIVGTFAAGPMETPYLLESMNEFDLYYGGVDEDHEASYQVRAFFQNGGERLWVSRARDAARTGLVGTPGTRTGVHALESARFNLLLVPELFTSPDIADRAGAAADVVAYGADRDAFVLLDPPAEVETAGALIDWLVLGGGALRRREAALYFGRLQVADGAGGSRWIGASGAAAGTYAMNDRDRGVWSTPAGPELPLSGVQDVAPLTVDARDSLVAVGINPVIRNATAGVLLWGGRTLALDPEFRYLSVYRLTLYLEARVRSALEWAAGESSEQAVWDRAREDTEAVLDELWRAGAFQGASAADAYFVRCDLTTHTAGDIAANRLVVIIGIAPLRPAEFIVRTLTFEL
jgi:phage tail sheath protein FI